MITKETKEKVITLYKQGCTYKEISRALDITYKSVNGVLYRARVSFKLFRWSEDLIEKVKYLHQQKVMVKDIALQLNVSVSTLEKLLNKLGLKYNNYEPIPLTRYQEEVLIGTLLGDTWLGFDKKSKNPRAASHHSIKQTEYFNLKRSIFKNLMSDKVSTGVSVSYIKGRKIEGEYLSSKFKANSELIKYQKLFYNNKIKYIDNAINSYFTAVSLAFWFMDDGYSRKGKGKVTGYGLCTNSFTKEDLEILIDVVYTKLRINLKITKSGEYLLLRTHLKKDRDLFLETVKPYIIESMKYKL